MPKNLPEDILAEIIDNFDLANIIEYQYNDASMIKHLDRARLTLLSLCRVSRQVCQIAQRVLQRGLWDDAKRSTTWRLALELSQKPEWARRVKAISIEGLGNDLEYDIPQSQTMVGRHRALQSTVERLAPNLEDPWRDGLRSGYYGAELGLLLAPLIRLEVLLIRLTTGTMNSSEPFANFLSMVQHNTQLLPNLRSIIICYSSFRSLADDPGGCWIPHHMEKFLDIPSVRELHITCLWANEENEDYAEVDYPPGNSKVEKLDLDNSQSSTGFLRSLMVAFGGLKWFRYHWNVDSLVTSNDIGLIGLLDNLLLQKSSLETIILDTGSFEYFVSPWELIQPIGPFTEFPMLQVLEISPPLLVGCRAADISTTDLGYVMDDGNSIEQVQEGHERSPDVVSDTLQRISEVMFPPSLEVLRILAPGDDFADRILEWLTLFIPHMKENTPRLRVLDITALDILATPTDVADELTHALLDVISRYRANQTAVVRLPLGAQLSTR